MQEDLALDTGSAEPEFDVYLSYAETDQVMATRISDRLAELQIRAFDERDRRVGLRRIAERQRGIAHSKRLAVLLGPGAASTFERAEAEEVVDQARSTQIPVFAVLLPGYEPSGRDLPAWLESEVDLRAGFDDDEAGDALVKLVAGALTRTFREAEQLVRERLDHAAKTVGALRALLVGVPQYEHYDPLQSTVTADITAVDELLGAVDDGRTWHKAALTPTTRDDLFDEVKAFFSGAEKDDTLLFYFTGHGALDGQQPQLVVGQTVPDDLYRTAFAVSQLAYHVRRSSAGRRIVVLDCCYAGEAGTFEDWGDGTVLLASSRQWVRATGGVSELTAAITTAWRTKPATAGQLRDIISSAVEVHVNRDFDSSLPLPRPAASAPPPVAPPPPAVRLTVDHAGELHVEVSSVPNPLPSAPLEASLHSRRQLVENLLGLVDAVIAFAPREGALISQLTTALSAVGADLLCATLPDPVRNAIDAHIRSWPELRLELSFDDAWAKHREWERLLWESLTLCRDGTDPDDRPVTIERIVPAMAVKSGPIAFPPRRVIVWNALPTPAVRHDGESRPEPLLAHLLHRSLELGAVPVDLTLLSEQASTWQNLFGATMRGTIPLENGEPAQIGAFDTFVLFAHLSSSDDKPEEVWLRLSPDKEPTPVPATTLLEKLGEKWRFSRVVIETVADERRTGCLKATTALAARMARSLGVPVVGVCHTPQYAAAAKGMAEGQGFMPSFTGELLAALVQPDVRLDQAARQARRNLSEGLDFRDSVHVGLPIICRPERIARTRPSRPAPTTPGPPR